MKNQFPCDYDKWRAAEHKAGMYSMLLSFEEQAHAHTKIMLNELRRAAEAQGVPLPKLPHGLSWHDVPAQPR